MGSLLVGLIAAAAPGAAQQRVDLPPALVTPGREGRPGEAAPSRALYLKLIANLRDTGRAHAALAHLDSFDRLYPRRPEAAVLRAGCLVDIREFDRAAALYRLQLRGPEAAAAHAGLGRIEGINGRWSNAASEFGRAVDLAPTEPGAINDYGYALLRSGRAADALFRLRQAAELAPGDAKVRNNLILALAATGDTAEAQRLLATIPAAERGEIEAAMTTTAPPSPSAR